MPRASALGRAFAPALASLACALVSCGPSGDDPPVLDDPPAVEPSLPRRVEEPPEPSPSQLCEREIQKLVDDAGLREATGSYYESVPMVLLTAKIVPVIYLERPVRSAGARARALREELLEARRKERAIARALKEHSEDKVLLREVFLADGYLYEETSAMASAAVRSISLADLFDEEVIYIHRGPSVRALTLEGSEYVDQAGERVSLLLNDRVATSVADLAEPLHLDADQVREETGAQRVLPRAVSADGAGVTLVYPDGLRTRALLAGEGHETRVVCEAAPEDRLERARVDARGFWEWVDAVSEAAMYMVRERPGFDEPVDEPEGDQEDGKLRIAWRKAYYRWESKFNYREEEYRVFDRRGNPTPPQVCIDFIFDTWERSSGTWFRKRGQRPGRTKGYIDFKAKEGLSKRHTPSVLEYARENPSVLERFDFSRRDQAPFRRRRDFARAVAANADEIREGDLLVIHGLREEDMEEHYHTMLVLRTDPLSGVPMVVADNAGRPRIRNMASAMRSAPRRSIKHRLRIPWSSILEGKAELISGPAETQ